MGASRLFFSGEAAHPIKRVQPAKLLIVARGDSQTNVAKVLPCRRATLCAVLNGTERASAPLRAKLAAYLGVPAEDLFVEDEQ